MALPISVLLLSVLLACRENSVTCKELTEVVSPSNHNTFSATSGHTSPDP